MKCGQKTYQFSCTQVSNHISWLTLFLEELQKLSSALSPCKSVFNVLLRGPLSVPVDRSLKWKAPIIVRRGNRSTSSKRWSRLSTVTLQLLSPWSSSTRMLCRRIRRCASSSISAVHPYLPAPNTSSVSRATSIQMWYSSSGSNPPSTYSEAGKANFWSSSAFQNPRQCVKPCVVLTHFSTLYIGVHSSRGLGGEKHGYDVPTHAPIQKT